MTTEDQGYDAGGLLSGGGFIIPASTLRPEPQLTPEQVAHYHRMVAWAARLAEQYPDRFE